MADQNKLLEQVRKLLNNEGTTPVRKRSSSKRNSLNSNPEMGSPVSEATASTHNCLVVLILMTYTFFIYEVVLGKRRHFW